jgi:hypothetical protein
MYASKKGMTNSAVGMVAGRERTTAKNTEYKQNGSGRGTDESNAMKDMRVYVGSGCTADKVANVDKQGVSGIFVFSLACV